MFHSQSIAGRVTLSAGTQSVKGHWDHPASLQYNILGVYFWPAIRRFDFGPTMLSPFAL